MDNFEQQLKQAMTPKDPPPDFTAKVMRRIATPEPEHKPSWWIAYLHGQRAALAGGLALLIVAGSGTAYYERQMEQRRQAEKARDQLMLALQITSVQLNHVSRVMSSGMDR